MLPYFSEALRVLLENRMRSVLTIVGLVAGIAAIVAIQVAAHGMAGAVNGILKGMNTNTYFVFPKSTQQNGVRAQLHLRDIALVEQNVPGVVTGMPLGNMTTVVRAGHQHVRLRFGGESDKRFSTAPVRYGRTLNADDIGQSLSVCVLSDKAYTRLFPDGGDVTGQSVYVGDKRYEVVGVLGKATIDTAAIGFDLSDDVAIPYTTFYSTYLRGSPLFGIQLLAAPDAKLSEVEAQTVSVLAAAHGGAAYQSVDFGFFYGFINGIFNVIGTIVGAVGAISLIVAGIGIMNIMLVSVTERTREIGIRKAIGAKRSQVLLQFFIEALTLSAIGCLIGMALGLAVGFLANQLFIVKISGVTAPLPWLEAILIAAGFATLVTIAFGTYPAYRAARLDPIEALRYE